MVPVGDQQLLVGERLSDAVRRDLPQTRPLRLQCRLAGGMLVWRRAVVEEEDRLGVRPEGFQQPLSSLLRACVRPLVWQDDSILVRLDLQRRDQAAPGALDSVRPDVPLL